MNYADNYPFWLGKETFRGGMAAPHNLGNSKESLKSNPSSRGKPMVLCRYFIFNLRWQQWKVQKEKHWEQLASQQKWKKSAGKQKQQEQKWRTHFKLQIPIKAQKIFKSLKGRWLGIWHLELKTWCRKRGRRNALKCGEIE